MIVKKIKMNPIRKHKIHCMYIKLHLMFSTQHIKSRFFAFMFLYEMILSTKLHTTQPSVACRLQGSLFMG